MPSFVDSLRLNSIYPSGGNNPFGSPVDTQPNFDAIARIANMFAGPMQQNRQQEVEVANNLAGKEHINRLQQIAAATGQAHDTEVNKPMNVVMAPSAISPLDKAKLDLESKDLSRKTQADRNREDIQRSGVDVRQQNADIAQQRADIYHGIMDRKDLSDSQKLQKMNDIRMNVVNAQQAGANTRNAATITGANDRNTATIKGEGDRQETAGTQRLAEIAARNANTSNKPQSNEQQLAGQNLAAQKLVRDRPDLAPFIKSNKNGSFNSVVSPNEEGGPTQEQFNYINGILSGTNKDINLDDNSKFNKPLSGETKTPPASKYKVTVR